MREHEVFQRPDRIDVKGSLQRTKTPSSFQDVKTPEIEVLRLASKAEGMAGWCTDPFAFDEMPDVEWICGGVNSKTSRHAGIWRQGNLLHFGFQESPPAMNETGRSLLVNAICYAAKFKEPPIARTPSPFVDHTFARPRMFLERALERKDKKIEVALAVLGKQLQEAVRTKTFEELKAWYEEHCDYLRAGDDGRLVLDTEAKERGMPVGKPEFFARGIERLQAGDARAAALLARDAPDGPGDKADAKAWSAWWSRHRQLLFFTERGGYRWHLGPARNG
jgi:hypothetical protein